MHAGEEEHFVNEFGEGDVQCCPCQLYGYVPRGARAKQKGRAIGAKESAKVLTTRID